MTLNIYKNETNKIIYTNNNIIELLELYNININSEEFQELFETELLSDIFDEHNINSSNVYYELLK